MWARDLGEAELAVNRLCRSCHDDAPNPGEHPAQVVAWSQDIRGTIFSNTPGEMPVYNEDSRQARVGNIGCPTCHNVHREVAEGRPDHLKGLHARRAAQVQVLPLEGEPPLRYRLLPAEILEPERPGEEQPPGTQARWLRG
jgi:hypothetical protein